MEKLKCVFMGTPDFSVPTLKALHHHDKIEIVKVITMPDRRAGRGKKLQAPPVAEYAKENGLPLFQTENINKNEDVLAELATEGVDLIMVIAFAQFLGSKILNLPKLGCFNIHTSILPKYRGAAPIQYALLNGDPSTGVSIQKMVKKMDAGDLGHFKKCEIDEKETGGSLFAKLQELSGQEVTLFINNLIEDKITWTPQDETQVSFAPSFKKEDGLLKPENESALEMERKVRAFFPWPGTYGFLNGKRIKVLKSELSSLTTETGLVNTSQGTLILGTKDGSLRLSEVQLAGKKPTSDQQFINNLKSSGQSTDLTYSLSESQGDH